jgi:hypothetical protein
LGATTNDTQEKINMKDHDILVSTHTLMGELMRRFEGYIDTNNTRIMQNEREISEIARNQVRLDSENMSLKGMINALDERLDETEKKWKVGDLMVAAGTLVAGLIAWFKP